MIYDTSSRTNRVKLALKIFCMALLFACIATSLETSVAEYPGVFEVIKTKTFDKEKFIFPDDLKGRQLNILFLGMSKDRENGEVQQQALLVWHKALAEKGIFSERTMPYHFPVMENPPFFVKGIIRGAMSDAYVGTVPLNQCGVLFVDDLTAFAKQAKLPLDEEPTIVLTSSDGMPLVAFKGDYSDDKLADVISAISGYVNEADSGP